jgi:hypothetical protein
LVESAGLEPAGWGFESLHRYWTRGMAGLGEGMGIGVPQLVEGTGREPVECGFESRRRYVGFHHGDAQDTERQSEFKGSPGTRVRGADTVAIRRCGAMAAQRPLKPGVGGSSPLICTTGHQALGVRHWGGWPAPKAQHPTPNAQRSGVVQRQNGCLGSIRLGVQFPPLEIG